MKHQLHITVKVSIVFFVVDVVPFYKKYEQ